MSQQAPLYRADITTFGDPYGSWYSWVKIQEIGRERSIVVKGSGSRSRSRYEEPMIFERAAARDAYFTKVKDSQIGRGRSINEDRTKARAGLTEKELVDYLTENALSPEHAMRLMAAVSLLTGNATVPQGDTPAPAAEVAPQMNFATMAPSFGSF